MVRLFRTPSEDIHRESIPFIEVKQKLNNRSHFLSHEIVAKDGDLEYLSATVCFSEIDTEDFMGQMGPLISITLAIYEVLFISIQF